MSTYKEMNVYLQAGFVVHSSKSGLYASYLHFHSKIQVDMFGIAVDDRLTVHKSSSCLMYET